MASVNSLLSQLDAEIITDVEALNRDRMDLSICDIVVIGLKNTFGNEVLRHGPKVVELFEDSFIVHGRKFNEASLGE